MRGGALQLEDSGPSARLLEDARQVPGLLDLVPTAGVDRKALGTCARLGGDIHSRGAVRYQEDQPQRRPRLPRSRDRRTQAAACGRRAELRRRAADAGREEEVLQLNSRRLQAAGSGLQATSSGFTERRTRPSQTALDEPGACSLCASSTPSSSPATSTTSTSSRWCRSSPTCCSRAGSMTRTSPARRTSARCRRSTTPSSKR